ncbi:MAG: class I SAM-dependent methyltransferase, partial [Rhizobiales bacterium]|nr:class I SAM-dependent methyltransferase [Hyphomicrobiales bacterium]
MRDTARSYDEIIYPGNPVPQSHPDRLAAVASLAGMQPAPPARCRVLDIGCGIGGNLMAMAYQWPESTFGGIDSSPRSIEICTANIAELGLANVTLT